MLNQPVYARLFTEYEQKNTIYFADRDLKTLVVSAYLSSYLFVWKPKARKMRATAQLKSQRLPDLQNNRTRLNNT